MDIGIYIVIGIVALVLIIIIGWWISTSNNFRRTEVKINEAESGIDVALTKRYDTLTKMLDITRAYAKHETDVIQGTIEKRQMNSMQDRSQFNSSINEAMGRINAVAEQYPILLSSQVYKQLQMAAYDVEEHLQAARRAYNANVSQYNQMIVTFPKSIVAGAMSLQKKEFFEAESAKRNDVKIEFLSCNKFMQDN